jgi:DNA-binding protein Alba
MVEKVDDKVFISGKPIGNYITACFFALGKHKEIKLIARGNHVKRALDVLAIMIRDYLEDDLKYNVVVDSESHEKRQVTTVEIALSGRRKGKEE